MKKISIIFSLASVFTIGLFSCEDSSFLQVEVPGRLNESEFYKTDDDALQATTAVYDMMSAHYNANWASMYFVKTMPSDESNAGGANNGDQLGYQTLDDYTLDPQNDKVGAVWFNCYQVIYRANKIVKNVNADNALKERLVAEAKALRAIAYFDLVALWGDVPLILDEVLPSEYTTITRTPKADVYAQIEQDLKDAAQVLPVKSTYSEGDKFRIAKGTAQAYLGKVYLYQEKWADAASSFGDVIASGEYALENSIQKVFSVAGEFGQESLFELSFTSAAGYDWGNFPWGEKPESNIHVQLMGPRSDFYVMAPGDSLLGGWGFNVAKKKMYDAYVKAGDVNRRVVSMLSVDELKAAGGDWTTDNAYDFEGYFERKYGSFSSSTSGPINELNYTTNFRMMRYADVLLMAAEANFRNGNESQALTYLNQVRQRPGTALPAISPSGTALFDAIVLERQLELAFEGHRFLDLVRWGLANQELSPLGYVEGKHNLLPIPINDIRTSGLKQNDNY